MHEVECTITGHVQMVGFRIFAANHARDLGITGYVENTPEGDVHLVAQGNRKTLQQFVEYLRNGPAAAQVEQVQTVWRDVITPFSTFEIKT